MAGALPCTFYRRGRKDRREIFSLRYLRALRLAVDTRRKSTAFWPRLGSGFRVSFGEARVTIRDVRYSSSSHIMVAGFLW